jgi:hypothetical protein
MGNVPRGVGLKHLRVTTWQYKASPAQNAGLKNRGKISLLNVSRDEFGHLEHADLALAVEHWLERVIRIYHGALFLILAALLLDVFPQLFGKLGTRQRFGANDRGELIVRLHRSHEGGVRFTF